jgi:hypothetical protein
MKGRRQVKEGFSSLETMKTWIVFLGGDWARIEDGWARQKIEVPLKGVMIVGARRTGLSVSRTATLQFLMLNSF